MLGIKEVQDDLESRGIIASETAICIMALRIAKKQDPSPLVQAFIEEEEKKEKKK
jgi:hypothetical protein